MSRYAMALVLALGLGMLAGCSDSHTERVFPVQGQILFEGKPAAGAQVVLHPVGKSNPEVRPSGQVDGTGKFVLTTYASGDGAPPGDYEVTVEHWVAKNDQPAVNRLPGRYRHRQSSGLRATVAAGDNQLPVFKLSR